MVAYGSAGRQDVSGPDVACVRVDAPSLDEHFSTTHRVVNRLDETVRWVAATGSVLFSGGQSVRIIGTVEDIAQRRRMEQSLWRERGGEGHAAPPDRPECPSDPSVRAGE